MGKIAKDIVGKTRPALGWYAQFGEKIVYAAVTKNYTDRHFPEKKIFAAFYLPIRSFYLEKN
ncbi:hypothetical protein MTBBW1_3210002 [Desulfamplus magnetovallimortis]|uniref:Uncharacterized protein n=1 Tax=Desulfamplus magnetovallimortis TaxID=1246637 RepID=A0A1W1HG15_9BACT|nr:hypothetical protein MTBBW1_3210002 [Desulfamplus magnetovallimortis]